MKIVDVRASVLAARTDGIQFSIGRYDTFTCVLVEVETDDGLIGCGEAIARRGPEMACVAVESLLKPLLLGEDPADIERLWVRMVDSLRRWGHTRGVVLEAVSGVDTALWDIAGKALGQPIWRLLFGAGRRRVPVYASAVNIDEPERMAAVAAAQVAAGFTGIKVKIGRPAAEDGLKADINGLAAVRGAVGDTTELAVDANGAYDAATAIVLAKRMEPLNISFFEEPVPPDDIEGYARVHAMTTVPLAAGESEFAPFGFRHLIQRRLIDVVQPDVARCGGFTGARHVAAMSYAHNLSLAPHTGFSGGISHLAALHLAAAAPQLKAVEYMFIDNPLREVFLEGFPPAESGFVDVPDAPGLGLQLDASKVGEMAAAARELAAEGSTSP